MTGGLRTFAPGSYPDRSQDPTRPTLVDIEAQIDSMQSDIRALVTNIRDALRIAIRAATLVTPDLDGYTRAARLAEQIAATFQQTLWGIPAGYGKGLEVSLPEWMKSATALIHDLANARTPFTREGVRRQQSELQARAFTLVLQFQNSRTAWLEPIFSSFRPAALKAAEAAFESLRPSIEARVAAIKGPPPVVGSLAAGAMNPAPVPGPGRIRISAGLAALSPAIVTFRAPSALRGAIEVHRSVATPPLALPLILDLDRDGGIRTDARATVDAIILKMLALLPAGQIKLTLFDPLKLGESATFLFNLGDAAGAVIGEKVKSTDRELAVLLQNLEEHITFVTQKYLQGSYATLTEYNQAAGDVAEPYRILVLYDYPAGFVRPGGHTDEEALVRLAKIVNAGPRCGVFTLISTGSKYSDEFEAPVARLPEVLENKPMQSSTLAILTTGNKNSLPGLHVGLPVNQKTLAELAADEAGGSIFISQAVAHWVYRPEDPASPDTIDAILTQVQRGLASAAHVRVTPAHVTRLAAARLNRDVAVGTRPWELLPDPSNPDTWWCGSSLDEICADFGRVGATDIGSLTFDSKTLSGSLVGGRPGSGKSVLLHAIIASYCLRYSPGELELYLVDFKEGVEFKVYAAGGLPHARVVAINSEREFGLSVLESLDAEIARRGSLFRDKSGVELDLQTFRSRTGASMARVVLIVDEFHVLFERDDKISSRAAELLDRIVRQGRAFGVHTILASQTLAGTAGLRKHTLNQIPIRIALQCAEVDSRLLLGDDNADAQLLTRPGEGIFNASNGVRDANRRFQATYWSGEDRATLVSALASRASAIGHSRRPVVFEGHRPVRVDDLVDEIFLRQVSPHTLGIPLGLPMTLGDPVVAVLRREPGGNLLIVADDEQAYPALTVAVEVVSRSKASVFVCDFGAVESPWADSLENLQFTPTVRVARHRQVGDTLRHLEELVAERLLLGEYKGPPVLLVLAALHRARGLEPDGSDPESASLGAILRDGPEVGVHTIAWCDRLVSLTRRISSASQREFGLRAVGPMSREDSYSLVDSEEAADLDGSQIIFDDHPRARSYRLRRFEQPGSAWAAQLGNT